jgi:hypothetical protein
MNLNGISEVRIGLSALKGAIVDNQDPRRGAALPVHRAASSPCTYETPLLGSGLLFGCSVATRGYRLL